MCPFFYAFIISSTLFLAIPKGVHFRASTFSVCTTRMKFTHGVSPKPATCNAHIAYKEAVIAPNSVSYSYLKAKKTNKQENKKPCQNKQHHHHHQKNPKKKHISKYIPSMEEHRIQRRRGARGKLQGPIKLLNLVTETTA